MSIDFRDRPYDDECHMAPVTASGASLRWKIIKGLWIAVAVLILAVSLRGYDGSRNSDAEEVLAWGMLALSAPSGLFYAAGFAAVASLLHRSSQIVISTSYLSISISWVALFALGYAQWFVFVPWGIGRMRARQQSR